MPHAPLTDVVHHIRIAAGGPQEDQPDADLLQEFLTRRDEGAFATLVARYSGLVLGVCRRVLQNTHDAEDAAQASFLVLARQARRIRQAQSLPGWLYGTARRIALQARRQADRRRKREGHAARGHEPDPAAELMWREVQAVLDEEVQRLPQTQRSAFLLCCIEGLSHAEAGQRLGIAEGSVSSRVTRARQRLHVRLQRRGIELSAVLAAVAVGTTARATLSPAIRILLARSAVAWSSGKSGAVAGLSAPIIRLACGASRSLGSTQGRLLALVFLAAGVLGGFAQVSSHRPTAPMVAAGPVVADAMPAAPRQRPAGSEEKPLPMQEIQGRVLGPDGQPMEGAKLLLLGQHELPVEIGTAGAGGRFTVRLPIVTRSRFDAAGRFSLIAQAGGTGMDFIQLGQVKPGTPVELRLVKDQTIRGRFVDTQGKPLRGVRVTIESIRSAPTNSLDTFLAEWKHQPLLTEFPDRAMKFLGKYGSDVAVLTTDAEGRFTLRGMGREHLLALRVHAAGVADADIHVVNRNGFDPAPYNEAARNKPPRGPYQFDSRFLLYGPELRVVLEPEKILRGVVTRMDTGKPHKGAAVVLNGYGRNFLHSRIRTSTDAQGRYEIRGARKAGSYMLEVQADLNAGLLGRRVTLEDTIGHEPITADIGLPRGVVVTGRVIDAATGKALRGFAQIAVLSDNPCFNSRQYPKETTDYVRQETNAQGEFRALTIPGPVALMGGPVTVDNDEPVPMLMKYKRARPDPKYPQYFERDNGVGCDSCLCPEGTGAALQGNFCKVLRIETGTTTVHQDIVVEQASRLQVQIRDTDGRPVHGARVNGIGPGNWMGTFATEGDTCWVYDLDAGTPRWLAFYEPTRRLLGTLRVKAGEKGPAVATLGPGGSMRGRLMTAEGKPLARVSVLIDYTETAAQEIYNFAHQYRQVMTDARGVFEVADMVPGMGFKLYLPGRKADAQQQPITDAALKVQPGRTLDVGTLKVKPSP